MVMIASKCSYALPGNGRLKMSMIAKIEAW